ncbi:SCO5389 family protein, partial [Streptosporangium sandarakinum]
MSLTVSKDLLDQARAGEVDDEAFVACVRDSLPYAWAVITELVERRERTGAEFADNTVPPPDEQARGQLLRCLASDSMRGALERRQPAGQLSVGPPVRIASTACTAPWSVSTLT